MSFFLISQSDGHILSQGGRSFHKDGQIQSGQTGFRCQILQEKQIQGRELEWTKFDEIILSKFKQTKLIDTGLL